MIDFSILIFFLILIFLNFFCFVLGLLEYIYSFILSELFLWLAAFFTFFRYSLNWINQIIFILIFMKYRIVIIKPFCFFVSLSLILRVVIQILILFSFFILLCFASLFFIFIFIFNKWFYYRLNFHKLIILIKILTWRLRVLHIWVWLIVFDFSYTN